MILEQQKFVYKIILPYNLKFTQSQFKIQKVFSNEIQYQRTHITNQSIGVNIQQ